MGHRWNVRLVSLIWSRFAPARGVACIAMDVARAGRPRDFRFLLAAAAISQAGTQVSLIALPLVAVVVLHASTFQTGLLATAQNASFLLIGLPAGAWIDRLRRRPVLIITDAARALLLVTVPVAAAFRALTLPQLYLVVGVLNAVVFNYRKLPAITGSRLFGFWEMLVYLGFVAVGLYYIARKGVLNWSQDKADL